MYSIMTHDNPHMVAAYRILIDVAVRAVDLQRLSELRRLFDSFQLFTRHDRAKLIAWFEKSIQRLPLVV